MRLVYRGKCVGMVRVHVQNCEHNACVVEDWHHDFGDRGRGAGNVARERVDICNQLGLAALRGGSTDTLPK